MTGPIYEEQQCQEIMIISVLSGGTHLRFATSD